MSLFTNYKNTDFPEFCRHSPSKPELPTLCIVGSSGSDGRGVLYILDGEKPS
jgi:hypothetical protein